MKVMARVLGVVLFLLTVGCYEAGNYDPRCQEISDVLFGSVYGSASGYGSYEGPNAGVVYRLFHIDSEIVARYAITTITSVVVNSDTTSRELSFLVQIPDTAFISNFTMSADNKFYYGLATEKQEAAEQFEARQEAGENVGLVEARGKNLFAVRLNSAPCSEVTFVLRYEELIARQLSKFKHTLSLQPGGVVEDFQARVRVIEQQGVTSTHASDYVLIEHVSNKEVVFSYTPTVDQQHDTAFGLARDMFVEYDVNHPTKGTGLFIVNDCFFAQFFSPSGVNPVPVDLVFVIDVSGSMSGRKIRQTIEALETIINQLRLEDKFTMVTFESRVQTWKRRLVSVQHYRNQAINFAKGLRASGGTNFNGGLQTGAHILKEYADPNNVHLLVILTDGYPTVGVTSTEQILENAEDVLAGTKISLNCLGFGNSLNYNLLERLALNNNGIPRRIYEGGDAALQLEGFFEEISTPILHDLTVNFPDGSVKKSTETQLPILFDSNEFVVAGQFSCDNMSLIENMITIQVTGIGSSAPVTYESTVDTMADTIIAGLKPSTERLSAYLFIQQLLEKKKIAESLEAKQAIKRRALRLSLKYNFVTDLTSLLVVEDRDDTKGPQLPTSGDGRQYDHLAAIIAPTASPIATTFGRIPNGPLQFHGLGFGSGQPSRGKRDLTFVDDEDLFAGSGTTPPFPVTDVVLRLVGGANTCEGRLEMLVGEGPTWARAYDSYFGTNEARVVCRQLGCPADEPVMANATSFATENSGMLQTFSYCCAGEERNMSQCQMLGSMCSNRQTVAIKCTERTPVLDVEIQTADESGAVAENIEGSGYDDPESSALMCRSISSTVLLSTAILLTLFTHS